MRRPAAVAKTSYPSENRAVQESGRTCPSDQIEHMFKCVPRSARGRHILSHQLNHEQMDLQSPARKDTPARQCKRKTLDLNRHVTEHKEARSESGNDTSGKMHPRDVHFHQYDGLTKIRIIYCDGHGPSSPLISAISLGYMRAVIRAKDEGAYFSFSFISHF